MNGEEREALISRITELAEGNPGAMTVMTNLHKTQDDPEFLFERLEELDLHGTYIWVGYKDGCDEDIEAFAQAVRDGDEAMLEPVEEYRELRGDA